MAGLLAARVLAERFGHVVVIERDVLPPAGEHRRGVPHGRHLHGLHPRGREILEELFPGFTVTLTASGAVRCDVLEDLRWQLSGHQLRQARIGLPSLFASRPFLEGHLRAMVRGCPQSVSSKNTQSAALLSRRISVRSSASRFKGHAAVRQYRSRPAWWWTPPGEAYAPRSGWPSSATSARRRSGSR